MIITSYKQAVRFAAVFVLCSGLFIGQAHAQKVVGAPAPQSTASVDPEALAAVKNLMIVTRANANFLQVFDIITKKLVPLMEQANPQKQQMIQQLIETVFIPTINKHVGEITDQIAIVYAQNFSVDDMQAISAFYKSPIGQKYLDKTVTMMPQLMQSVQGINQKIIKEAMQDLADKMRQNNLSVPKEMGL